MDIDRALERAMDADDPGPAFTNRVIAAVKAEGTVVPFIAPAASRRTGLIWRAALPIAATLALLAGGAQWRAKQAEEARGRAAHAQLMQALRMTGEKLDVVHRAIERSQE
jgi:hypothetical protein